jgi:MacB-like periplasmic core domain
MYIADLIRLTTSSFAAYRMRSFLTGLGIAIGITAVILLTSIGEGLHQFVLSEFNQFGTNIIGIQPGKTQTHGASVGVFGTVKPLSIEDAEALRRVPNVDHVTAVVQGNADIHANGKSRRVTVYGADADFPLAFQLRVQVGSFLPNEDPTQARAFVVLGSKVRNEIFGEDNPLGSYLRVGGQRYRVIGVMESKGQILGFDMDDTVFIPVARGLELFNRPGVMEIDVTYPDSADAEKVEQGVRRIMTARHGREDYTVISQEKAIGAERDHFRGRGFGRHFAAGGRCRNPDHHDHGGHRANHRDRFVARPWGEGAAGVDAVFGRGDIAVRNRRLRRSSSGRRVRAGFALVVPGIAGPHPMAVRRACRTECGLHRPCRGSYAGSACGAAGSG